MIDPLAEVRNIVVRLEETLRQFSLSPISDELARVVFPPETMFAVINAPSDGQTFANAAIQAAIDSATTPVYLPQGRYLIDGTNPLRVKSGLQFFAHPGAVLVVVANDLPQYQVFFGEDVEDVLIQGCLLIGDRLAHGYVDTGNARRTHEWGMGVQIKRGRRITLRNITAREFTGDGFSLSGEDIHVIDCTALYNRRQGLSVYSARRVRIVRGQYAYTGNMSIGGVTNPGAKPMTGIDVEPDAGDVDDLVIDGAWIHDNTSSGVLMWSRSGTGVDIRNARVINCRIERVTNGVESQGLGGKVDIHVDRCGFARCSGGAVRASTGATIYVGSSNTADTNTIIGMGTRLPLLQRTGIVTKYDLLVRTAEGYTEPGVIIAGINDYL